MGAGLMCSTCVNLHRLTEDDAAAVEARGLHYLGGRLGVLGSGEEGRGGGAQAGRNSHHLASLLCVTRTPHEAKRFVSRTLGVGSPPWKRYDERTPPWFLTYFLGCFRIFAF